MKMIEAFPFADELDILEIHLNEMSPVVDEFWVQESTIAHSGRSKPLFLRENMDRFSQFPIVHSVVDDTMPMLATCNSCGANRTRERSECDYLYSRVVEAAQPDDVIIFGAADHIVRSSAIRKTLQVPGAKFFMLWLTYFDLNRFDKQGANWFGSVMCTAEYYHRLNELVRYQDYFHLYESLIRYIAHTSEGRMPLDSETPMAVVPNSGWHYSWIGDNLAIRRKASYSAHQGAVRDLSDETLNHLREIGADPLGRWPGRFPPQPIGTNAPQYVLDNLDRFQSVIADVE